MLKRLAALVSACALFVFSSVAVAPADTPQNLSMTSTSNCVSPSAPQGTTGIQVSGSSWTGTMAIQVTADGSNWSPINGVVPSTGASSTTIAGNGFYRVSSAGAQGVRVCAGAGSTGTAQVGFFTSSGSGLFDSLINLSAGASASTPLYVAPSQGQGWSVCDPQIFSYCTSVDQFGRASVNFVNNACSNTVPTTVPISISTATTTQIVAASSGNRVYGCNLFLQAGGTDNVTLKYGTGSSCGTGTNSLSGALPEVANGVIAPPSGPNATFTTPQSQAFCLTTSAAVQLSGFLSYVSAP